MRIFLWRTHDNKVVMSTPDIIIPHATHLGEYTFPETGEGVIGFTDLQGNTLALNLFNQPEPVTILSNIQKLKGSQLSVIVAKLQLRIPDLPQPPHPPSF